MIKFRLKELMEFHDVSIKEVTQHTGISRNTLSNIYNEKTNGIQFDNLNKLVNFFNCTIEEIIHHIPGTIDFTFISNEEGTYIHLKTEALNLNKRIYFDVAYSDFVIINLIEDGDFILQQLTHINRDVLELFSYMFVNHLIKTEQLRSVGATIIVHHRPVTHELLKVENSSTIVSLKNGNIDVSVLDHYKEIIYLDGKDKDVQINEGAVRIEYY